jgi:hypothetical protein
MGNAQQGRQPRRQPQSTLGPYPLNKGNHWRSNCSSFQVEGEIPPPMDLWVSEPPVQDPLLNINAEEPQVA